MTTPRAVHTTIRHLSATISRGETEIRVMKDKVKHQYYYSPKISDVEVAQIAKKIGAKELELQPVRRALAALADCIGKDLI